MFLRYCIVSVLLAVALVYGQAPKPLSADDLVQMKRAGFDDPTILNAIRVNGTTIDTSAQGLLGLKAAGLSDGVINAVLSTGAAPNAQPANGRIKLPRKTPIRLTVDKSLSSDKTKAGDVFTLTVAEAVVVDGAVVIAVGAPATGRVTAVKGRSVIKDTNGRLEISIDAVDAVDGQKVPLDARLVEDGGDTGMFRLAKNIEIKAGFVVNAVVDADAEVAPK